MNLSKGHVSQNGYWISYKTGCYGESIALYQKLAAEHGAALTRKGISTDGDYHATHAENSTRRKGCVTIKVLSKDAGMNSLPFESHAVD